MKNDKISKAVIKRLPRYRRHLGELQKKGVDKISSGDFSALVGCTASQIRQDLNNFGGFGQQGYGYNVNELYRKISEILGLDHEHKSIIIGAGNMGYAIANYIYSYREGFYLSALFDNNPNEIGQEVRGVAIRDMADVAEYIKEEEIAIAIICTNKESAQEVATEMCDYGIKGIWNFAPVDLVVKEGVSLENVHLSDSLQSLAYFMNKKRDEEE